MTRRGTQVWLDGLPGKDRALVLMRVSTHPTAITALGIIEVTGSKAREATEDEVRAAELILATETPDAYVKCLEYFAGVGVAVWSPPHV